MANPRGFLEVQRVRAPERLPQERVRDYAEIYQTLPEDELRHQASRCMDCGVPFCNNACPLGNLIPDWNDLARVGDWRKAIEQLHATNNFPEFTGLICPAPCESACVLDIDDDPVMIKQIEYWTINHAFEQGLGRPGAAGDADRPPRRRRRLRPGRHGRRRRAQQGRPPRHRLRARRGARRAAPVRGPGREAREVDHRPPHRDPRAGGDRVRLQRRRRPRSRRRSAQCRSRRARPRDRLADGARLRRARPRSRGRPLRDAHTSTPATVGWPPPKDVPPSTPSVRSAPPAARRRDRRRRHRAGLRLQRAPRGGARTSSSSTSTRRCRERRCPKSPLAGAPRRLVTHYALEEGGRRASAVRSSAGGRGRPGERGDGREVDRRVVATATPIEGSERTIEADLVLIAIGFTAPAAGLLDGLGVSSTARHRQGRRFSTSVPASTPPATPASAPP